MEKEELKKLKYPEVFDDSIKIDWSNFPKFTKDKVGYIEPKQETLEKAGLKHCDLIDKFPVLQNPLFSFKQGAKWQEQRMYSEKEVETLLETLSKVLVYQGNEYVLPLYFSNEIKQVITQFKNK